MFLRSAIVVRRTLSSSQSIRTFRNTALFQHAGCHDACNHDDTVVARCTQKISELLKPMKIKVTSSNDDPNGSHVSDIFVLFFNVNFHVISSFIFMPI